MTGFLQSLLVRGAGPSAGSGLQFATMPTQPRFSSLPQPTPDIGPSITPVSETRSLPPERDRVTSVRRPTEGAPLRARTPANGRVVEDHGAPHRGAFEPPRSQSPEFVAGENTRPAPLTVQPEHGAMSLQEPSAPEGVAPMNVVETTIEWHQGETKTPDAAASQAPAPRAPAPAPMRAPDVPSRPETVPTSIEIGRIEVIVAAPPAPAPRSEAPRSRGFASHDQRRLGPR